MKTKYLLASLFLVAGCGSDPGPAGPAGSDGADGADGASAAVSFTDEAAGANCANGGIKIDSGVDTNENGALDADEVSSTSYVCDGEAGPEGAAGADGEDGAPGTAGAAGADGADGDTTLIDTTAEAAGANCADGGTKLDYGVDDNGDGTLDAAEIDGTDYLCNGAVGPAGTQTLVDVVAEAAGANCANGGQAISWGGDDNGNGTLDTAEIDGTSYACNGADGNAGANGLESLVTTTDEPAGANCAEGGVRIDSGLDDNDNGTLETAEVDTTSYVCDGTGGVSCDAATEVEFNGTCYYLDGSAGVCEAGYTLAPQSVLTVIAGDFIGKTYKNQVSGNCCITHRDEADELQDWGMGSGDCNSAGTFSTGPELGGAACTDASQTSPTQMTLCMTL